VDPDSSSSVFARALQITQRLSTLKDAKGARRARNGSILCIVGSQLQEKTRVRSSLVELAGRMQKTGPVAQGGGQS